MAGAQINSQARLGAVNALATLAGQSANLVLGTNQAIASTYAQNVNFTVALTNAHTSRMQLEAQTALGYEGIKVDYAKIQSAEDMNDARIKAAKSDGGAAGWHISSVIEEARRRG